MTAEYSNTLDEVDQLNLVFGYGADVATRSTEEYQITLFQLFSFYVEIYSSGKRMLFEIKGFDDTDDLDIYLRDLNISGLYGI